MIPSSHSPPFFLVFFSVPATDLEFCDFLLFFETYLVNFSGCSIFQSKLFSPWTDKKETASQANAGISKKGPFKYPIVFALKFHDVLVMISWSNSLQSFKSVASMVQEMHGQAAHISPPLLSSPTIMATKKRSHRVRLNITFFYLGNGMFFLTTLENIQEIMINIFLTYCIISNS